MNKTVAVANYFVAKGLAEDVFDSVPPKIMALTYYAHGWFLGITGKPMLDREFVAAANGPDIPELSRLMRQYGNGRVTDLLRVMTPDPKVPGRSQRAAPIIPPSSPLQVMLAKVWKGLGKVGVYKLSDISCAPFTPWASVWYQRGQQAGKSLLIKDEALQQWFAERRVKSGSKMEISLESVSYTHLTLPTKRIV